MPQQLAAAAVAPTTERGAGLPGFSLPGDPTGVRDALGCLLLSRPLRCVVRSVIAITRLFLQGYGGFAYLRSACASPWCFQTTAKLPLSPPCPPRRARCCGEL